MNRQCTCSAWEAVHSPCAGGSAHRQCTGSAQAVHSQCRCSAHAGAQLLEARPLLERVCALAAVAPQPELVVAGHPEDHAELAAQLRHRRLEDAEAVRNVA